MTWICISMSDTIRTRKNIFFISLIVSFNCIFKSTACRYLSIIFDAMDPTKCPIPFVSQGPGMYNIGENANRLQSQVASVIVHGKGTYGIVWDEQISKDGNFWAGNLMEVIKEIKETHYEDKPFPDVLYLQADNASCNKNLAMFGFCELMRNMGIFRKVKYSFLPINDTREDNDACFDCLEQALKYETYKRQDGKKGDTLTFEALESVWKGVWGLTKLLFVKVNLLFVQCEKYKSSLVCIIM